MPWCQSVCSKRTSRRRREYHQFLRNCISSTRSVVCYQADEYARLRVMPYATPSQLHTMRKRIDYIPSLLRRLGLKIKHPKGLLNFLEVPARFVCIFLLYEKKNYCSPPSSRRRQLSTGQLHVDGSNLSKQVPPKGKAHHSVCFSFWRYRPELNWRMRVLQTLALPLGHGTIYKNRNA